MITALDEIRDEIGKIPPAPPPPRKSVCDSWEYRDLAKQIFLNLLSKISNISYDSHELYELVNAAVKTAWAFEEKVKEMTNQSTKGGEQ